MVSRIKLFVKNMSSKIFASGAAEKYILQMLASAETKMYGLQMIEASGGRLKRGTIYVTLMRMEEKGLISSSEQPSSRDEIGISRRFYSITENGRAYLEEIALEQS